MRPTTSACGHETDMPKYLGDVRCWVNSGKYMLAWSFSDFDPERKSRVINVQGRSEPKPKRFMISRRFVDYLFRGVINYDRRLEILELG